MNKSRRAIILGLDIDDTITKAPAFFALLTHAVKDGGGCVYIVSSRTAVPEAQRLTELELTRLGVAYDDLYLLPGPAEAKSRCPHQDLDWYQPLDELAAQRDLINRTSSSVSLLLKTQCGASIVTSAAGES